MTLRVRASSPPCTPTPLHPPQRGLMNLAFATKIKIIGNAASLKPEVSNSNFFNPNSFSDLESETSERSSTKNRF